MSDWKQYLSQQAERSGDELNSIMQGIAQNRLREASSHMVLSGGKRLRAVLPMMSAGAVGGDPNTARAWGLSLEIIHNFTLIHDDIMDGDETRRGKKTVHFIYGNATAINAGDVLFARAIEVLDDVDASPDVRLKLYHELGSMVRHIGEGQQQDMDFEDRDDVTEQEYLNMIEGKTSRIFDSALWGGALLGGADEETAKKLGKSGRLAGMGFQIWDDYLDLMSTVEKLGKPVGSDIRNGKKTLMVLHFLENAREDDKETFFRIFKHDDATDMQIDTVRELFRSTWTLKHVEDTCADYIRQTRELTLNLPENEYREHLQDVLRYMVNRDV